MTVNVTRLSIGALSQASAVLAGSAKRGIWFVVTVALVWACHSDTAIAGQSPRLTVAFTPERLGRSTTVHLGFQITASSARVPSPLTQLDLFYPAHLGIGVSGLGLEACSAATLEAQGPSGCPTDSIMGHGSAFAEVPFGTEVIGETTSVAVVRAPDQNGRLAMMIYAEGVTPVDAAVVFPALVTPARRPFGGDIKMTVPLVPSLPEGPDVAVVRVSSTIGPSHLTYYEDLRGRRVPYTPRGILLPERCPKAGFKFAATFGFLDGSRATVETSVPCPRTRGNHRRRRHHGSPKAGSSTLVTRSSSD
jgi:hypothetical protein